MQNDVTTKFIRDERQPYFTIKEINDKFKLIVDIDRYETQLKPGLPYKTSISVTLKHESKTETRQIDLRVFFLPKLE